jgi:hypothetical protein
MEILPSFFGLLSLCIGNRDLIQVKICELEHQVGKAGFEPARPRARDPKSRLSANSSTSPIKGSLYLSAKRL